MKLKTYLRFRVVVLNDLAAVFICLIGLSAAAFGATDTWSNSAGGDWSNSSNWSPRLPGSGAGLNDDAENLLSNAPISFNTSATVDSFFSQSSDFNLLGGTLAGSQANAASTVQVNGVLSENGGGLSNLTLNQGVGGSVIFTNNGNNFISAATLASDLTFGEGGFAELYNANSASSIFNLPAASRPIPCKTCE